MATPARQKAGAIVVSALQARASLGRLLDQADGEGRSLVIAKRGTPRAVLLSVRDYVKLAAPEPEVLRLIGEASERRGTDRMTAGQIDRIIRETRAEMRKKRR